MKMKMKINIFNFKNIRKFLNILIKIKLIKNKFLFQFKKIIIIRN